MFFLRAVTTNRVVLEAVSHNFNLIGNEDRVMSRLTLLYNLVYSNSFWLLLGSLVFCDIPLKYLNCNRRAHFYCVFGIINILDNNGRVLLQDRLNGLLGENPGV
jgi:hypothetical protein